MGGWGMMKKITLVAFVLASGADAWELYNLTDDISEATNLIGQKPELAATLSHKIKAWLGQQHPTWQPKYPLKKESDKPAGPPPFL
jgi:hypothetical protein